MSLPSGLRLVLDDGRHVFVKGIDDDRHAEEGRPVRATNERKSETRGRILAAAGTLFRRRGIDAVGVDAVMHEAGLTHGGFYVHFPSKEALAAEVCADQLARSAARWAEIAETEGREEALARIVAGYLSEEHLASPERGCIVPVLGPELARRPASRPAFTEAICCMITALARCLPRGRRPARGRALAALSTMVGAVVLARLSADQELSRDILAAARRTLLPPEREENG
jgi:TetR/AcrR family transcriptional regulator, transcriptional repressor for nem operon